MNTMQPGMRPTYTPTGILIHPTIWAQYTNVTDRTDTQNRQRSDSIGRTVLQMVTHKQHVQTPFSARYCDRGPVLL